MRVVDTTLMGERTAARAGFLAALTEALRLGRMRVRVEHRRARDFLRDPATGLYTVPDPRSYVDVDEPEEVWNQKTNVQIVQQHTQCYGTTSLLTCGFNYIALSNDSLSETSSSTTLSNEITTNGLGRAQGTVTLPVGSGTTTTIAKTFTASGNQSAQKCAFFTAVSSGVMGHALAFTQRALIGASSDTLTITGTLTLS